jgi:hypothetical protein
VGARTKLLSKLICFEFPRMVVGRTFKIITISITNVITGIINIIVAKNTLRICSKHYYHLIKSPSLSPMIIATKMTMIITSKHQHRQSSIIIIINNHSS